MRIYHIDTSNACDNNLRFVAVISLWCLKVGFRSKGTRQRGRQVLTMPFSAQTPRRTSLSPLPIPSNPHTTLEHHKHLTPESLLTIYYNQSNAESRGPLSSEKFLCPLLLRLSIPPVCSLNWNHGKRRRTLQSCTTRTCIIAVGSARTECQDH